MFRRMNKSKTLKQLRKLWKDGGARGGESNSDAKIAAAKANAQKAREALALKRAMQKP